MSVEFYTLWHKEINMKKGWKIGICAAIAAVIVLGVIAVIAAGKMDRRKEALKAIQNFFEVSKENEWNQYLDYCRFEELFFDKDVQVSGTFYTDISKYTVQADLNGIIDKSGKKVQISGDAGLGGIPFAEFDMYSDDKNLYLESEKLPQKSLKFDYTGNLDEVGKTYGISHRNLIILQKGYTLLFQTAVAQNKYEIIEKLLEENKLDVDWSQMYEAMTVERQENPDEQTGGYLYHINFQSEEQKVLKDIEITVITNKDGVSIQFGAYDKESGYEIILKRNGQEKEDESGFENQFCMTVMKDGAGIVNGEIVFDYTTSDGSFELQAREEISGMNVTAAGTMKPDSKNQKFIINVPEIKIAYGEHKVKLKANMVTSFGDFTVELPENTPHED